MPLRPGTILSTAAFVREVYDVAAQIPAGKVLTYGAIARLIGQPFHARHVGRAMAAAPQERKLPCHRVVHGDGSLVPGWTAQRELLEAEGVAFRRSGRVDLGLSLWTITGAETDGCFRK